MSSFPVQAIAVDNVKAKFKEQYVSAAMNRKLAGYPVGVYRGFTPAATGPDQLTLSPDVGFNDHVGMVEVSPAYTIHIRFTGTVVLDFTGHNWITDPVVYVCLRGDYIPPPAGSSSAQIQTLLPSQIPIPGGVGFGQIVKICQVTKPGANIVVDATIPSSRQTPFAYTGTTSGFMPGGSIEQLLAAILTTAEVQQARTGLRVPKLTNGLGGDIVLTFTQGSTAVVAVGAGNLLAECSGGDSIQAPDGTFVIVQSVTDNTHLVLQVPYISPTNNTVGPVQHGFHSLDARLDAELAGGGIEGMATRLAKDAKPVLGSLYVPTVTPGWPFVTITPPSVSYTKANVSNDFRTIPVVSAVGAKGACANPPDNVNNLCYIVDVDFNDVIDAATINRIYGRLQYDTVVLTGTLTFTNGSTLVTGDAFTTFNAQVIVGDIVQGPDGNFYTVVTVTDDSHLTLLQNFSGITGPIAASNRRRWTVTFETRTHDGSNNPLDTAIALQTAQLFRFYFHQIFDAADHPPFSDPFILFRNKSAAAVPTASTTIPGIVLLGVSTDIASNKAVQTNDTRLGTIKAKQGVGGSVVGPEPILTFIAGANMSSVTVVDAGTELEITFNAATQSGGGGGASLGSATPLPDSNAGAVGSSTFASHEDHQHPREVPIVTGNTSVSGADSAISVTFQPRAYFNSFTSGGLSGFGFAAGVGPAAPNVQGCVATAAGTFAFAGTVLQTTSPDSYNINTFSSSTVNIHHLTGANTYTVQYAVIG